MPGTARTQHVTVWGHCAYGPALKGSFTVKHPKPVVRHRPVHHWQHHHMCGCQHADWNHSGWMKHHADASSSGYLKHHPEMKQHTSTAHHASTTHK